MAVSAAGTELAISARVPTVPGLPGYAALTYLAIGGVEKLGTYGGGAGKTTFQPLKGGTQKHKGPVAMTALSPTLALDENDAGQILLRLAADHATGRFAVKVTYPDGGIRYFTARIFGIDETADDASTIVRADTAIEILTPIVKASDAAPLPAGYEFVTTNGGADFVTTNGGAERVTIKVNQDG
jgi:hypothetical protein